jgi:hypothetical protein
MQIVSLGVFLIKRNVNNCEHKKLENAFYVTEVTVSFFFAAKTLVRTKLRYLRKCN